MRQRENPAISRSKFNNRMNSLKQATHGEILLATRSGWYELKEPILRGYIRLRAEKVGVKLAQDHPHETGARTLRLFGGP